MITTVVFICFGMLLAAAALALYRLLRGPTLLDRIVSFDMGAICIVGMIVLLSIHWDTEIFVEIIVIFSLLGFLNTVAFVSYLHRNPQRMWHGAEKEAPKEEHHDS